MKNIFFALVIALFSMNVYAANGDLTVSGTINAGAGGVKFSDGSSQTTAKRLVCDQLITAPTTSVTCSGLDGIADGGYEYEFIVKNAYNGVAYPRIWFNGDKTQTGAYYSSFMYTYAGAPGVFRNYELNLPLIVELSTEANAPGASYAIATGTISITPDGVLGLAQHVWRKDGAIYSWQVNYRNTVANLTRIQIEHTNANGIGVNSRFRLWKKIY